MLFRLRNLSHDQHLAQHVSHVVQLVGGERDLGRVAPESIGGDGADLLGDDPAPTRADADAMHPAGTFDARQRQHADQVTGGQVEMEARRHHQRRPVVALLATTHRIDVDESHLAWLIGGRFTTGQ
jgi:hypothetical protein